MPDKLITLDNLETFKGLIEDEIDAKQDALPSITGNGGKVLKVNSGETALEWANDSGMANPMTSAGDLIVGGSSGTASRLAKGTAGQVLSVNSGGTGLEWSTPASGGVSSLGGKTGAVTVDGTLAVDGSNVMGLTGQIPYLTTAPVADNTAGFLKIVVLSAEPANRFSGFLYVIVGSSN